MAALVMINRLANLFSILIDHGVIDAPTLIRNHLVVAGLVELTDQVSTGLMVVERGSLSVRRLRPHLVVKRHALRHCARHGRRRAANERHLRLDNRRVEALHFLATPVEEGRGSCCLVGMVMHLRAGGSGAVADCEVAHLAKVNGGNDATLRVSLPLVVVN